MTACSYPNLSIESDKMSMDCVSRDAEVVRNRLLIVFEIEDAFDDGRLTAREVKLREQALPSVSFACEYDS